LALITTTSIHGKSIQYDRLKQLKFIGYTKGFGTSHISASFMDKVREYLKVNNPEVLTRKQSKWQLLKFVAQKLNIDSSQLFYHGDQRGIYYGWTGTNANEFLLKTKMNFVQDKLQSVESTASFWKQRWAKQRATHLNKIGSAGCNFSEASSGNTSVIIVQFTAVGTIFDNADLTFINGKLVTKTEIGYFLTISNKITLQQYSTIQIGWTRTQVTQFIGNTGSTASEASC
ncbi:unnamed protein product, partial [Adineta steineri]